jgi:hypothetical protein
LLTFGAAPFYGFFGSGCRDDQVSADAKNLANASGAFTSCLAHAMSSGDCSSSAADVRVRNSLLQFGFDQDAIIQCSASCVLCGWGFDSSDDVLGLQLEATGVVRAVNSNRVSVSVEKLPGSSDFEATASCDCIGGAKEAASAFWKLDTRAVIGQSSVYSQNYVDDGLHTAVTVARGSSSEGGLRLLWQHAPSHAGLRAIAPLSHKCQLNTTPKALRPSSSWRDTVPPRCSLLQARALLAF